MDANLESSSPVPIDGELFHTLFSEMCKMRWSIFADDLEKHINFHARTTEKRHVGFEEAGMFLKADHVKMPIGSPLLLKVVYFWRDKPFLVAEIHKYYYIINKIKET